MKHLNTPKALACCAFFALLTGCVANPGVNNTVAAGGGITNTLENVMLQDLAANLVNGQIGSQLQPIDQNFRVQQLNNVLQSGTVNQSQQWVNPQTGSAIQLNPVGQQNYNAQTQKQCQTLQETVTMPNGQAITENRVACLNPQTGQWALAQ